jgi:energy-coupling factor transporter transmembrane protein EcfT
MMINRITISEAAFLMLLITCGSLVAINLETLYLGLILSLYYSYFLMKLPMKELLKGSLVLIPFLIILFTTWVFAVGTPPGYSFEQNRIGAFQYSSYISMRLFVIFAAGFSLSYRMINDGLVDSLSELPLNHSLKILIISSLTTLIDFRRYYCSAYETMLARGLIKRGSIILNIKSLPAMLRVVLVSGLSTALKRSELWEARGYLQKLKKKQTKREANRNYFILFPFVIFLMVSAGFRLKYG